MKRIIISVLLLFLTLGIYAQENNQQEKIYVPESGDWSFGFDLFPYIRSLLVKPDSVANRPFDQGIVLPKSLSCINQPLIAVKSTYMLSDNLGFRMKLGFAYKTFNDRAYVDNDSSMVLNPLAEEKVIDTYRSSTIGGSLALGLEYRKGNKRVQGIVGGNLLLAVDYLSQKNTYGNAMTAVNQYPSTFVPVLGRMRILSDKTDGCFIYTGLSAFFGGEWFIAPKLSLGAEVSITGYYFFGLQQYAKTEFFNASSGAVEERIDLVSPGSSGIYLGTESLGGVFSINFYF